MSAGPGATRHRVRRVLRETRARLRHGLGLALRPLLGTRGGGGALDPATIRSVLVVRINGRLGNTLFMTPLLRQLHALLPQARIDVAVSYPNAATLLAGMPGLGRVITFPHKGGAGTPGRYLSALRALRAHAYDLAIEPTQFSTGGRIVLAMSRSKHRLGFATPTQWAPLTHAVDPPLPAVHMGREPVYLLARGFNLPWEPDDARLWLPLTDAEIAAGAQAVRSALAKATSTSAAAGIAPRGPAGSSATTAANAFGFFAHATGLKALGAGWWQDFWAAFLLLAPDAQPVEFLPGAATPPVDLRFASLNLPAQRLLTAAISTNRMFISADGGPLHLASSTDTPTIGLFNGYSDPALYGALKPADRSNDVRGLAPQDVAQQVYKLWLQT